MRIGKLLGRIRSGNNSQAYRSIRKMFRRLILFFAKRRSTLIIEEVFVRRHKEQGTRYREGTRFKAQGTSKGSGLKGQEKSQGSRSREQQLRFKHKKCSL